FEEVRRGAVDPRPQPGFSGAWAGLTSRHSFATVDTGVSFETLRQIAETASRTPQGFAVNPKLARLLAARQKLVAEKGALDWGTAGGRLALRRAFRGRAAAPREREGHPPGDVHPPPLGAGGYQHRRALHPSQQPPRGPGRVLRLR